MILQPKDLYEKLEFDKILKLLEAECLGTLGIEAIQGLKIMTDAEEINRHLTEVKSYKLTIEEKDHFPLSAYQDISEDLYMLAKSGYVLPVEGLQRINQQLLITAAIYKFFTTSRQEIYSSLFDIIRPVDFDKTLTAIIEKVIDEKGEIKPDASPELQKIRRHLGSKQRELDRQFKVIINNYRSKGWLTDSVESFRNGRRVLSVPSEHKRKIRGIIHDESTTGKTAFIEPEAIIDINNDIFDLETEEKREIYRILRELSETLRPYVPALELYQQLLVRFDVILAKARLAIRLSANKPIVISKPRLGIKNGFHPLLYLKNLGTEQKTVPFDLVLFNNNRVLMLSGPNAGGKSITMKSVGLLQLMLQAGMLIPVDEQSEMGVYNKLFADIGDQQSLEDDLSTYSSRLQNMRVFLEQADDKTMVLIDEFGSGTDPKIGGAIAEAILKQLNQKKVYGVITTHYSNLKMFAFKAKGIINGSMTFNKESLSPTYQLKVGRPGSSYAFEIAQKSGLSKQVLNYAKHKTGKSEKAVDELLIDLQKEKKELEEKLNELSDREKKLQKLIKNYEDLHRNLEYRRKKLKLDVKEQALQQTQKENKQFEKLIREIKEEKNLEKAKQKAASIRAERQNLTTQVEELKEDIYHKSAPVQKVKKGELEVGDYVKMRSGGATGKIESINKKTAIVVMGEMKMTIKLRDLQHANEPLEIQKTKGIKSNVIDDSSKFESKIDLRGMSQEEALRVLERFVDKALISSATILRIVHGKGTGALRKAVKVKLREYDAIQEVFHPRNEEGGDGVTIVQL